MGVTYLDASALPPTERAGHVREAIWSSVARVDISHHPDPAQIRAAGTITRLGRLTICSISSNVTSATRTSRLVRDGAAYLIVAMPLSGSIRVAQAGREAAVRPRDMVVYDTTEPYTITIENAVRGHWFRLPLDSLALPESVIRDVSARRLSSDRPLVDVVSSYLHRLAGSAVSLDRQRLEQVAQPTAELVRALVRAQALGADTGHEALESSLATRILEYARDHLSEPNLRAAVIAKAQHISVRHLYAVLAASDVSLGDWIRENRLEEIRRELVNPASNHRTIEAIARRWGYGDATHFGRSFKQAYGITPSDWRRAGQDA
ncbi:helix-turn-helix domain-containing protein [Intrasporangium mesophilum]